MTVKSQAKPIYRGTLASPLSQPFVGFTFFVAFSLSPKSAVLPELQLVRKLHVLLHLVLPGKSEAKGDILSGLSGLLGNCSKRSSLLCTQGRRCTEAGSAFLPFSYNL
ncbi:unnamed protein product [Caretta caretta]